MSPRQQQEPMPTATAFDREPTMPGFGPLQDAAQREALKVVEQDMHQPPSFPKDVLNFDIAAMV